MTLGSPTARHAPRQVFRQLDPSMWRWVSYEEPGPGDLKIWWRKPCGRVALGD